ncbi:hypothetical protein WK53_19735 [Burkholderia ubonensis]|uniref:Uncharacterized protein n=2 Tax=Burkholderia ubonensis TaxID=101571 RepID=A0AAW3N522_9BURK|nr:hypothetical protein [Burkholderia ubonensis]KVT41357.1 hypothetical protein WK53_19735 [Burkholderia ubonensis]
MQATHHFHPEVRHATVPTYVASYIFPAILFVYEIYRIGYWIINFGLNVSIFREMGYEFILMLGVFGVQIAAEVTYVVSAWLSRHPDLEHRLPNVILGLASSAAILAFDYALQVLRW